jgi:hypothetical protein
LLPSLRMSLFLRRIGFALRLFYHMKEIISSAVDETFGWFTFVLFFFIFFFYILFCLVTTWAHLVEAAENTSSSFTTSITCW